ncbi:MULTISPECIES: response regulator [Bacillaceae]|uniref:Response regulator n=1 Tax=Evansella alkalicola TaxID=745819 RepID=A0ABS6JQL6_9BACI|nr:MULTISPECIES: response regulator [Bacillaceae]MBU9720834.1 response regulator [Bacillus alkalicola]
MDKLSILVCDDSETVRNQMVDCLKKIGITDISEAKDGVEAVDICHAVRPNLVFMDIIMPKKDGIAALKEIHQAYPEIKIIMASSTSGQAHLKNSIHLGAYGFIQKPIEESILKEIIKKLLNGADYPSRV